MQKLFGSLKSKTMRQILYHFMSNIESQFLQRTFQFDSMKLDFKEMFYIVTRWRSSSSWGGKILFLQENAKLFNEV